MEDRVLFVDDDANILAAYQRKLRKVLKVETAEGPGKGLELVTQWGPFAVVIADMHMPGMNGIEFLARVKEHAPDTVRMMLTGAPDMAVAMEAVNEGNIFRFLTKPCPPEVIAKALTAGINQYRLVMAEKDLLGKTLNGAIELLAEILALVDPEAFGRAAQLRSYVKLIAQELGLAGTWELELAALLAQIGCVAVPHEVLVKAHAGEPLAANEKTALACVPAIGQELLVKIPRLESVAKSVLYQNKCYDGSGFPSDSVAGNDIPLESRILKVLNDMLEIESGGAEKTTALEVMQSREGWYDPRVLRTALAAFGRHRITSEAVEGIHIRVKDLRADLVLVSDVRTLDGRLLMSAGHRISEPILARIKIYAGLVGIKEPIEVRRPRSTKTPAL